MKRKLFKLLSFLLVVSIVLNASPTVVALNWDGSSAGGTGGGSEAGANGYAIRTTEDNCLGYRFSVLDKSGNTKNGKVIDVFRDTYYGNVEYSEAYKFTTKCNKKQLIANQNNSFGTASTTANCFKEKNMGFARSLPTPDGIESWQNDGQNLNPILLKLGIDNIPALKNGDKIIVEPLFDVRLQSTYHSVTVTELAIYGKYILGAGSDGGSSGTSASWGFISDYTNRHYPNALYTPDGQGLWPGVSALSSRATFYNIINKGYGAGIAYTETKPDFTPNLSVNICEAWPGNVGNRVSHFGISNGATFGNYTYGNGYPTKGDKVWFTVNFPAESQNCYVRQTVWVDGGGSASRQVYSNSNTWYDVSLSPTTVDAGRKAYLIKARVDWIDTKGNVLKMGAEKTFYIPIRPKIDRTQVSMYDYSGKLAAKGGANGYSGAVYVGQTTYPQYTFTSDNTWNSVNHFRGSLHAWQGTAWQPANGGADLSANNISMNQSAAFSQNSSLYPYRVQDNSKNNDGTNRVPFLLTSQWVADAVHTKESTWIDIPVIKADVELLDIKLIDANGYYINENELWARQIVTPQYFYRNNSEVNIYVEGYDHDTDKIPGVYTIAPDETICVNGKPITVPNQDTFFVWGGVYLEGAGRLNTAWETDRNNNNWLRQFNVKHPLSIETVAPNSSYREGTQVITSFKVKNSHFTEFVPNNNITVKFTAENASAILCTMTKTGVVVPGNNEQLVYFKWTVPKSLDGASITIQGEVLDSWDVVDTTTRKVRTAAVIDSQTPDTEYTKNKPSDWSQPAPPSSYSTQATWSEWIYTGTTFQKKNYGIKIADSVINMAPSEDCPSAVWNNGTWDIKSGYGVSVDYSPACTSLDGYLYPSSTAFTAIQRGYMQFPEFGYLPLVGKYRTLQRSGSAFLFAPNSAAKGQRVHFLPIWYPNGDYQMSCYFYDLWTPAGMVAARQDTNKIIVNGSMYDDWYVGRKG